MSASAHESVSTRVDARIYRYGKAPLDLRARADAASGLQGFGFIQRASTSKGLAGAAAGTWSLSIKSRYEVTEEISPGDWIVIWWSVNGIPYHGTMGRVIDIRREKSSTDGATVTSWSLSGKDFVDVIDRTQVWFDDYNDFASNVGGKILGARFNFVPGGTPDAVVENILDAWLGSFLGGNGLIGGGWVMPTGWPLRDPRSDLAVGGKSFDTYFADGLRMLVQDGKGRGHVVNVGDTAVDANAAVRGEEAQEQAITMTTRTVTLRGEMYDESSLFRPATGTGLAQTVLAWSNPLLNELFFDVNPSLSAPDEPTPCVFLREKPYVTTLERGPWFSLPLHEVTPQDVLTSNVGMTDEERINAIYLYAANIGGSAQDQYAVTRPGYSQKSLQRHGIRKIEEGTRFAKITGRPWDMEVAEWLGLLACWYGPNHRLLNGSVTLRRVFPQIRVGHRIAIGDRNSVQRETYYVESVSHTWTFPQGGTTSLQVTRGYIGSDDKIMRVVADEAQQFQRDDGSSFKIVLPSPTAGVGDFSSSREVIA